MSKIQIHPASHRDHNVTDALDESRAFWREHALAQPTEGDDR